MTRYCIVPNCVGEKNRSVFKAPKHVDRRLKWLKAIWELYPDLDVKGEFRVCEKHFRSTDFTSCTPDSRETQHTRKRLKYRAVPNFDEPEEKPEETSTNSIIASTMADAICETPSEYNAISTNLKVDKTSDKVQICRACLGKLGSKESFCDVFQRWAPPWDGMQPTIAEEIAKLTNVKISETDKHSHIICCSCYVKLLQACQFIKCVQDSDMKLSQIWPEPIKVDTQVFIDVDVPRIKQELLSDDENAGNYCGPSQKFIVDTDLEGMEIKIEPEEFVQPSTSSVTASGDAALEPELENLELPSVSTKQDPSINEQVEKIKKEESSLKRKLIIEEDEWQIYRYLKSNESVEELIKAEKWISQTNQTDVYLCPYYNSQETKCPAILKIQPDKDSSYVALYRAGKHTCKGLIQPMVTKTKSIHYNVLRPVYKNRSRVPTEIANRIERSAGVRSGVRTYSKSKSSPKPPPIPKKPPAPISFKVPVYTPEVPVINHGYPHGVDQLTFARRTQYMDIRRLELFLRDNSEVANETYKLFVLDSTLDKNSFQFLVSSKELLQNAFKVPKELVLQINSKNNLHWVGYQMHFLGTSDCAKKFHLICIFISSTTKAKNYEYLFEALKSQVTKIFNVTLKPKVLIVDTLHPIVDGFREVFSDCVVRISWPHLKRNLDYNFTKNLELNAKIKKEVLDDMGFIQLSDKPSEYQKRLELFLKKWHGEQNLLRYLTHSCFDIDAGWYEGYHIGSPSSNENLVKTQTDLGTQFRYTGLCDMTDLFSFLENVVEFLSGRYTNGSYDFSEFVGFEGDCWFRAHEWLRMKHQVTELCHEDDHVVYLVSSIDGIDIKPDDINLNDASTLNEYWSRSTMFHKIYFPLDKSKWSKGRCTCVDFCKNSVCKHFLGSALLLHYTVPGYLNVPEAEQYKKKRVPKALKGVL